MNLRSALKAVLKSIARKRFAAGEQNYEEAPILCEAP
jgi:hypothetical protein